MKAMVLGICLLILSGLDSYGAAASKADRPQKGEKLYTRFSLFYERGVHITTNYRRGTLLPINSPVTFVKASGSRVTVLLEDKQKLEIQNVKDFSGEDLDGILQRTLSTSPTDLSNYTEKEREAIKNGKAEAGMSKAAVKLALGYPPKHRTPSLDSNEWRYWSSRYGTFIVQFANDKLTAIKD